MLLNGLTLPADHTVIVYNAACIGFILTPRVNTLVTHNCMHASQLAPRDRHRTVPALVHDQ